MPTELKSTPARIFTAFAGHRALAAGDLATVASSVKQALDGGEPDPILVFDDSTGAQVDLDLHGSLDEVEARYADSRLSESTVGAPRGPGRPKLGVVAREVTLLPRHWDWLNAQPGGASVALRKLVEDARRGAVGADSKRQSRDAAYRFMTSLAGNLPGYEESVRALYAADAARFSQYTRTWPPDVAAHAARLAAASFDA